MKLSLTILLCGLTASLGACGSGEAPSESAAEAPPVAAPPAAVAALSPHEMIVGSWQISLPELIKVMPEAQRAPMRIAYFSYRDVEPTDAEATAAGMTGPAAIAVGLTRQKLNTTPQDPMVQRGMAAMAPLAAIGVVATATNITLTTPDGPQAMTWEMTSETADTLTFASHEDDGVKTMTAHFNDDDTVVITEVGSDDPPMTFVRAGTPAAAAVALRSIPAAQ